MKTLESTPSAEINKSQQIGDSAVKDPAGVMADQIQFLLAFKPVEGFPAPSIFPEVAEARMLQPVREAIADGLAEQRPIDALVLQWIEICRQTPALKRYMGKIEALGQMQK